MDRQMPPPKSAPSVEGLGPHPHLTHKWVSSPSGISISSAICAQLTRVPNTPIQTTLSVASPAKSYIKAVAVDDARSAADAHHLQCLSLLCQLLTSPQQSILCLYLYFVIFVFFGPMQLAISQLLSARNYTGSYRISIFTAVARSTSIQSVN